MEVLLLSLAIIGVVILVAFVVIVLLFSIAISLVGHFQSEIEDRSY